MDKNDGGFLWFEFRLRGKLKSFVEFAEKSPGMEFSYIEV